MRPAASFIGQSVRSLQTMLRYIAAADGRSVSLIPDGIYGKNTAGEVTAFQRKNGLPPTGVADNDTWDAIVAAYEPALTQVGEATPIAVVFEPGQIIRQGEEHPNVFLLQALLQIMARTYGSIPPAQVNGIIDLSTAQALSEFQLLSGLPATGELDRHTWDRLARHYTVAVRLIADAQREKQ